MIGMLGSRYPSYEPLGNVLFGEIDAHIVPEGIMHA
jgi:hypothetical protein